MDVLAKARAALDAGADPVDVLTILQTTNSPAADLFGKENIVKGDWVPNGAEFDEGSNDMDWYQTMQALVSLLQQPQGGAPAAPSAPAQPPVGGGLGQQNGPPAAFAGLGEHFQNPQGQGLWVDTVTGNGGASPEEDPWYKGLLGSMMSSGEGKSLPGQSGYEIAKAEAPAMVNIPQQQRRPREAMQFNIPPALRSLMGG